MNRKTIWDEMQRMQEQMDMMFDSFFSTSPWQSSRQLLAGPSNKGVVQSNYRNALTDVSETDKEVIATVELPGVEKKDININATDNGVEIKVEKSNERKEENKGSYRFERSYAGFYRFIPAPDGVDVENIKASYKNGVLELRMPKVEAKRKAKRISVE